MCNLWLICYFLSVTHFTDYLRSLYLMKFYKYIYIYKFVKISVIRGQILKKYLCDLCVLSVLCVRYFLPITGHNCPQVFPVAAVLQGSGQAQQLLFVNKSFAVGDLFDAADL
jgi:hypothetical protein